MIFLDAIAVPPKARQGVTGVTKRILLLSPLFGSNMVLTFQIQDTGRAELSMIVNIGYSHEDISGAARRAKLASKIVQNSSAAASLGATDRSHAARKTPRDVYSLTAPKKMTKEPGPSHCDNE